VTDDEIVADAERRYAGLMPELRSATVVNVHATDQFDVYVGRGRDPVSGDLGRWGNPFSVDRYGRAGAMRRYFEWLESQPDLVERARRDLAGKVLACWCKPKQCHGDVLAGIANGKTLAEIRAAPEWSWVWVEQRTLFE
jgi:hypothetical protein